MPIWKKNIFVRVILRKMQEEGVSAEEIIKGYPALTEEERTELLASIVQQPTMGLLNDE